MRKIDGYVFVSSGVTNTEEVFGKPINYVGNHENFHTNGLVPYSTPDEAINSAKIFVKTHGRSTKTRVARLEMSIAENEKEFDLFRDRESLVVIMGSEYGNAILGPVIEGKLSIGHLPGADVCSNGFKTFSSVDRMSAFEAAYYLGQEVNRQAQSGVRIGSFKIEFIE